MSQKQAMGRTLEERLNRDPPSPYKRRKIDVLKQLDLHSKSTIPIRFTKTDQLQRLKKANSKKMEQINHVNTEIMGIKSSKHRLEFEKYDLEKQLAELKGQFDLLSSQISELKQQESTALDQIQTKYQLSTQEAKYNHTARLNLEKDKILNEAEKIVKAVQQSNKEIIDKLEQECSDLEARIKGFDTASLVGEVRQEYEAKQAELLAELEEILRQLSCKIAQLEKEETEARKSIDEFKKGKLADIKQVNDRLKQKLHSARANTDDSMEQIKLMESKKTQLDTLISDTKHSITTKTEEINTILQTAVEMEKAFVYQEQERRYLHNKLQDLKGKIRVYCRIRPSSDPKLVQIQYDDEYDEQFKQRLVFAKEPSPGRPGQAAITHSYDFEFDKIFKPSDPNPEIFQELSQMIQSALDGFNVCVFAYGQTGSGKTWTMSHKVDGMIPLSINKIFNDIAELKQGGWTYTVQGQFLEIYNDNIVDLLTNASPGTKYEIKHDDQKQKTLISNLSSVALHSADEALALFAKASLNRSTASTKYNERSSRSHSIFMLDIKGTNSKTGNVCEGKLNLVDLAGSEKYDSSQSDRAQETIKINKSLSSLGDVIASLRRASNNHIPYRNSTLTYLLKHSLGGDSKTLMFVNISPLLSNFQESLSSFRFAKKVCDTTQGRRA